MENPISVDQLTNLRENTNDCFVLESYSGQRLAIPRLVLFYNSDLSSFILERRIHKVTNNKKLPSFNHIIIDDLILEDEEKSKIPEIFQEAINKIEDGKCLVWEANKTFLEKKCSMLHC